MLGSGSKDWSVCKGEGWRWEGNVSGFSLGEQTLSLFVRDSEARENMKERKRVQCGCSTDGRLGTVTDEAGEASNQTLKGFISPPRIRWGGRGDTGRPRRRIGTVLSFSIQGEIFNCQGNKEAQKLSHNISRLQGW